MLRGGRLHRLYEVETDAGKATKALVRLNDVLVTIWEPDGEFVVVVPDTQLERPPLRTVQGVGRSLPFARVERSYAP